MRMPDFAIQRHADRAGGDHVEVAVVAFGIVVMMPGEHLLDTVFDAAI